MTENVVIAECVRWVVIAQISKATELDRNICSCLLLELLGGHQLRLRRLCFRRSLLRWWAVVVIVVVVEVHHRAGAWSQAGTTGHTTAGPRRDHRLVPGAKLDTARAAHRLHHPDGAQGGKTRRARLLLLSLLHLLLP